MPTHSTRCAGGPRDERRSPNAGGPVTREPPTGGGEQPDFSADSTHRPNGGGEGKRPQRGGRGDAMFRKLVEEIELRRQQSAASRTSDTGTGGRTSSTSEDYPPSRPGRAVFLGAAVVCVVGAAIVNWAAISSFVHLPQIKTALGL